VQGGCFLAAVLAVVDFAGAVAALAAVDVARAVVVVAAAGSAVRAFDSVRPRLRNAVASFGA